jgi:hypothetical protein
MKTTPADVVTKEQAILSEAELLRVNKMIE